MPALSLVDSAEDHEHAILKFPSLVLSGRAQDTVSCAHPRKPRRRHIPDPAQETLWPTRIDPAVLAYAEATKEDLATQIVPESQRPWVRQNLSLRDFYNDWMLPELERRVAKRTLSKGTLAKDRQALNRWELASGTAGAAAAGFAVLRHWRSVLAGRADVCWPPQIENLRQLELLTEEGPDREFWQCVFDAATEELGYLGQRRYDWNQSVAFGAADTAVADEVNLFLQRIFSEEPEAMVATQPKPKAKRPANAVGKLKPQPSDAPAPVVASDIGEEPLGPPPAIAEFSGEIVRLPLDALDRSPYQTRREKPAPWLAESLRIEKRNTEAILVRTVGLDGRHEIISGHTRVLEARRIGWTHIEGRIIECDDETARRLVFVANAKREDLSAIEQAESLQGMVDQYAAAGKSQRQLARDIGVSQAEISNLTRLLTLPEAWRQRVISGEITKSVGRMLATWTHRPTLLERIGQEFERDSKVKNWSGWTEDDTARTIQTEIHFLTEGVPASCPPEKWTELDVEDVPTWNGSEKRCWNKPLAKKLAEKARAAREQRQAKAAAARDSGGKNPSKGKKAAAAKSLTEYQLKDAWEAWFARRLRERLTGKLSKAERELAAKFAFAMEPEPFWTLQKHFEANGKRISTADALNRIAATSWQDLQQILLTLFIANLADKFCNPIQDIEEAIAMATPFGITVDRFRPDAEFLAVMPEPWLEIFCAACRGRKCADAGVRAILASMSSHAVPKRKVGAPDTHELAGVGSPTGTMIRWS